MGPDLRTYQEWQVISDNGRASVPNFNLAHLRTCPDFFGSNLCNGIGGTYGQ